jgi:hypothetical protein
MSFDLTELIKESLPRSSLKQLRTLGTWMEWEASMERTFAWTGSCPWAKGDEDCPWVEASHEDSTLVCREAWEVPDPSVT